MSYRSLNYCRPIVPNRKVLLKKLVVNQNNKCYWCQREFGTAYIRKSEFAKTLQPTLDHKIPYSYIKDHEKENFVAACNLCNSFKGNRMFLNKNEGQKYLKGIWNLRIKQGEIILKESISKLIEYIRKDRKRI